MKRDFGHDGMDAGDGILTLTELDDYIDHLEDQLSQLRANGRSTRIVDIDIDESRKIRDAMIAEGVSGLNYLPPQIRDARLPANLNRRAAEILFMDNRDSSDRITNTMITRAKRRYSASGRTAGSLRNETTAIDEINDLARALGAY